MILPLHLLAERPLPRHFRQSQQRCRVAAGCEGVTAGLPQYVGVGLELQASDCRGVLTRTPTSQVLSLAGRPGPELKAEPSCHWRDSG